MKVYLNIPALVICKLDISDAKISHNKNDLLLIESSKKIEIPCKNGEAYKASIAINKSNTLYDFYGYILKASNASICFMTKDVSVTHADLFLEV